MGIGKTGDGMDFIKQVLADYFEEKQISEELIIKPEQERLRALWPSLMMA